MTDAETIARLRDLERQNERQAGKIETLRAQKARAETAEKLWRQRYERAWDFCERLRRRMTLDAEIEALRKRVFGE